MNQPIEFNLPSPYNASEILFHNLAAGRGDKVAVYCEERTVTYGQLCQTANRCANALTALGLGRGARILQALYDTEVFPAAFFGTVRAGFVPILANTSLPADEYAYCLQNSEAEVALVEADLYPLLASVRDQCPALKHVIVVGQAEDALRWDELLAAAADAFEAVDTGPDDMAFWMYSSGSTGRPKGIVHRQRDIRYTCESYARHVLNISTEDVTFSVPKLFFAYGFGNNMTFPYAVGASTILHPGRPTPEVAFELIERFKPTIFFAVPTIYVPMLAMENAKARDLSSLRLCISAAEALPPAVYQEWLANYGVEIVEGLGSTEVLHIYLSNYPGRVKTGATGTNVPGYELKLVDGDGQTVGPGETGDMMVRGLSTAPYYWNRPEKTEYTMRDDWIFTGDRFYQDEDGYFHFNGRSDEMMKVSGQWVSPVEVEQTLARHPAVLESAVIAVKNEAGLVRSKAFIALHADYQPSEALTRELQTFVKGELAPYKYPRLIEFVAELPKTGTNKIDRMKIKQMEEK